MDPQPEDKVTHQYLTDVMANLNKTLESYTHAINELQNKQRQDDYDRTKQQQLEQKMLQLERDMQMVKNHGQNEEREQNTVENDLRRMQNDVQQMQRRLNDTENRLRRIK